MSFSFYFFEKINTKRAKSEENEDCCCFYVYTWDEAVEGDSSHVKVRWRCRRRMTGGNKYQKSCERKFVFWNCFYERYNHIEWECFCVSSGCSYPPYVFFRSLSLFSPSLYLANIGNVASRFFFLLVDFKFSRLILIFLI